MSGKLLRLAEVMTRLDLHDPKTVMALIRQGKLRAGKVGRVWRFDPRDLEAYIQSLRFQASTPAAPQPAPHGRKGARWTATAGKPMPELKRKGADLFL